jgi:hypothetical protein
MSLARAEIIGKAMEEVWNRIVETPDGLLVDFIAETTEDICGFKPERELVEQFLSRRAGQWPDAASYGRTSRGVLHTPAQVGGRKGPRGVVVRDQPSPSGARRDVWTRGRQGKRSMAIWGAGY